MAPAPQRRVELMAPAGGPEAGLAALQAGADAIYLGLRKFSARADADNFGPDELEQIVGYAHSLTPRRRVFVAVNTLVLQRELGEVIEALGVIAERGADAVIVQDLGVAALARRHFPQLRLHSSTQLAVHDRAGVETARRLGFARVTLARELTLDEIRDAASVEGIEVESFVHGALCYCYSGLCLFSSQLIGRSGNRGSCAYPCRDRWEAGGAPGSLCDGSAPPREPRTGFAFSMKDLALGDHVDALRGAGVASLKIEGRKKSPLYVAAAVGFYRRLLDGGMSPAERRRREEDLQTIFARPWTSLYLRSHRDKDVADPDLVGHRGAPIGVVEAVVRAGREVRVRFRSARALALHDGLQIALPGLGRPFGFAVDSLSLSGAGRERARSVVEAPAGATVEVGLPDDYPTIAVGSPVFCSSSQEVKRRYRTTAPNLRGMRTRRPLDVEVVVEAGRIRARGRVSASSPMEASAEVEGAFEPAQDESRVAAGVRAAFEKLGDTRFELRALSLHNPERRFAPASKLNELRRALVATLEARAEAEARERIERITCAEVANVAAPSPAPESDRPVEWALKVDRVSFLTALSDADLQQLAEVVIDLGRDPLDELEPALETLAARIGRERIRLGLPMVARGWEARGLERKIARLREAGFDRFEASNLSAWARLGIDPNAPGEKRLTADWPLYTNNRAAARALLSWGAERITLSPEDGIGNLRELLAEFGEVATVVVYQDTPLFISESCAYANLAGGCPGKAKCTFELMELTSDHGPRVLAIDDRCRTVVVNAEPYCLAGAIDELRAAGARRLRADFVWRPYSPEQVAETWRRLRAGERVRGHVANFRRGLG